MKTLLVSLIFSYAFVLTSDIALTDLEENQFALLIGDENQVIIPTPQNDKVNIGEKMSRIGIKTGEIEHRFKQGTPIHIYARGKVNKDGKVEIPCSIIRLVTKGEKSSAQFILNTSKAFKAVSFSPKSYDLEKMIYKLAPNSAFTPGVYCVSFNPLEKGNLVEQKDFDLNAIFFEVTE
jgi:hypothetical protein